MDSIEGTLGDARRACDRPVLDVVAVDEHDSARRIRHARLADTASATDRTSRRDVTLDGPRCEPIKFHPVDGAAWGRAPRRPDKPNRAAAYGRA